MDLHLKGLAALGAQIELENGYAVAAAPGGLKGTTFEFPLISVGATKLLAATLAHGTTVLKNAAVEPEITDLANLLVKMGSQIDGIGRSNSRSQAYRALAAPRIMWCLTGSWLARWL